MSKTPDYTKKAVSNYRNKFDLVQVRFPKGTKERLKSVGIENINEFIVNCVLETINRAEEQSPQALEVPAEPSKPANRDYLPLTPENIAKVDLKALLSGGTLYQMDIWDAYGPEGFDKLVAMARKEEK